MFRRMTIVLGCRFTYKMVLVKHLKFSFRHLFVHSRLIMNPYDSKHAEFCCKNSICFYNENSSVDSNSVTSFTKHNVMSSVKLYCKLYNISIFSIYT